MIQTPTEQDPSVVCAACKHRYDLSSWQTLPTCGSGVAGGVADGQKTPTRIVQNRRCPCGTVLTIQFPLPVGTTSLQAEALHAISLLGA